MNQEQKDVARQCLEGSEGDTITFPQIVGMLVDAGFDGYLIDYRRNIGVYYHQSGDSVEISSHRSTVSIAPTLDANAMRAAITDAQALVPGYTYLGFCDRVMAAGCAGYMVSVLGRRAVYFGRTAEMHVEHFPDAT